MARLRSDQSRIMGMENRAPSQPYTGSTWPSWTSSSGDPNGSSRSRYGFMTLKMNVLPAMPRPSVRTTTRA